MELIKRLAVFALVSMTMISAGCIWDTTNNSQKQSEVVTATTKTDSVTANNQNEKENKGESPDVQTSPSNEENEKSKNEGGFLENLPDNKVVWALGGAGIACIAMVGWRILRKYVKENTDKQKTQKHSSQTYASESHLKPRFRVGNLHNIGRRDEQQDSFCISDINDSISVERKGIMAVVADGMGGLEGGAAISQMVADTFLKEYAYQSDIDAPAVFLYDTAKAAETAVEKYMERSNVDGGSTLVAILIKGDKMHFLSVGDSHIYLISNEKIILLNKEHNFAAVLKEKAERGEVAPDEPYVNPRRNSLTAYIGMGSFQIMDTNREAISLNHGDKVFLCSDGVFNTLKEDEIKYMLLKDAVSAAKELETAVLTKGIPKQDNFTGVIVEYMND